MYRDDLQAAHLRIVQLEQELAGLRIVQLEQELAGLQHKSSVEYTYNPSMGTITSVKQSKIKIPDESVPLQPVKSAVMERLGFDYNFIDNAWHWRLFAVAISNKVIVAAANAGDLTSKVQKIVINACNNAESA